MTIEAISRILAITSKCRRVMIACRLRPQRNASASTTTMAKPEYIAPTTK